MHRVINYFTDLQDNNHEYNAGDIFPREGIEATAKRIKELSGKENKQGIPLIELVEEENQEPPATDLGQETSQGTDLDETREPEEKAAKKPRAKSSDK